MEKNDYTLAKRIKELAERAYNKGQYVFTDFLTPSELQVFYNMKNEISYVPAREFGGTELCERKMLGFGSEELCAYDQDFPICCIKSEALIKKFSDELTHRDFLGAIMNLGITRELIGDIFVKDNTGYIFCHENIAGFISDNLIFVKHTHVNSVVCSEIPEEIKPSLEESSVIVSSNRLDGIISGVYNVSRSKSLELFKEKKVFVNGRLMENNSMTLKNDSVVSVRGKGKFIFKSEGKTTGKGRLYINILKYV